MTRTKKTAPSRGLCVDHWSTVCSLGGHKGKGMLMLHFSGSFHAFDLETDPHHCLELAHFAFLDGSSELGCFEPLHLLDGPPSFFNRVPYCVSKTLIRFTNNLDNLPNQTAHLREPDSQMMAQMCYLFMCGSNGAHQKGTALNAAVPLWPWVV
jgi:hypothetical protein